MASRVKFKGAYYTIAFLLAAILVEFAIVQISILMGVSDSLMLNIGFLKVSPLFHILPIIVIFVLVLCWLYLKEALTLSSYRSKGKPAEKIRKKKPKRFQKINELFSQIKLPNFFRKKISGNNDFKGAFATLFFFFSLFLITYLIVYPNALYNFTYFLFKSNPSLLGFAVTLRNFAFSIGRSIPPLGWLASSIDNGLKSAAPGFRNAFGVFGGLIEALDKLDATSKYILCQNLAAWIPVMAVFAYGKYVSRPRRMPVRRRKGR